MCRNTEHPRFCLSHFWIWNMNCYIDFWTPVNQSWAVADRLAEQNCNDPACVGHFYLLAFNSPQIHFKMTRPHFGSWWINISTHTLWWSPWPLFKKISTHCRVKWSQLFPLPVKFVQWPKSTWQWLQMASSHPAAHYLDYWLLQRQEELDQDSLSPPAYEILIL